MGNCLPKSPTDRFSVSNTACEKPAVKPAVQKPANVSEEQSRSTSTEIVDPVPSDKADESSILPANDEAHDEADTEDVRVAASEPEAPKDTEDASGRDSEPETPKVHREDASARYSEEAPKDTEDVRVAASEPEAPKDTEDAEPEPEDLKSTEASARASTPETPKHLKPQSKSTVQYPSPCVFESTPTPSTAEFRCDVKASVVGWSTQPAAVFENSPERSAADFCYGRVAATLDTVGANVAPFSVRDVIRKLNTKENKDFAGMKKKGFEAYHAKDFVNAYKLFTLAVAMNDKDPGIYSIRSAAALRLNYFDAALQDAKSCTELSPEWFMGYCRMGLVYMRKGDPKAAIQAFEQGLLLEPTDITMQQGIAKAKRHDGSAEPVIGIDFGTSKTCVGMWVDDRVEILDVGGRRRTMPSCVAWSNDGSRLLGQRAFNQMAENFEKTVVGVKRLLGQKMTDPKVQDFVSNLSYRVISGDQNQPLIQLDDLLLTPEEISAMLLSKMKNIAEERLGVPVKKAVITIPAYFNDAQRHATRAAGEIAGLEVVRIINEPTAAAIAYGVNRKDNSNVLIFDLGGGNFDASILHIEDGVFEVKATGGDTHLGGIDFDNNYLAFLVQAFLKEIGIGVTDKQTLAHLKLAAERSKRDLSANTSSVVTLSFEGADYCVKVERSQFEEINMELFARTISIVKQVLADAKMEVKDVDEVVLVGCSTHIPKIQELLREFFNRKDLCTSVNPEEAVAFGAAVQSAILSGIANEMTDSLLLVEVTALPFGLETEGNYMSAIIPRNTRIPCKRTEVYTTTMDMQTSLKVRIFEGERIRTNQNRLLGEFDIFGIEEAVKGKPRLAVTFALDNDGILSVTAVDRTTGAKADCTINDTCKGLSPEEIRTKLAEADKYRVEDSETEKKVILKAEVQMLARKVEEKQDPFGQLALRKYMKEINKSSAVDEFSASELQAVKKSLRQLLATL